MFGACDVPVNLIVLQDGTAIHKTVYGIQIAMVTMVSGVENQHHHQVVIVTNGILMSWILVTAAKLA